MFKTEKSNELYERFYCFSRDCASLVKSLRRDSINQVYSHQLIRSSSSIPANYLEAQESLSRKDFLYRLAICRKESKESVQWLRLLSDTGNSGSLELERLLREAHEFVLIFGKSVETARSSSYESK
ncbi:MAG: S23 ribosomal protein [candidate division WWE3 bacterium CSP1-7]|uniref:S23 ribosomal protein n=1 Tax=candidate division WWE3 bacterium CSP1-7 TaxID=1576480 RepID=A0A0T5ZXE6_UNCKA|nr:MAG: S23 ribosomal protein [candidate division WWE3 bacterium CSP1-7]